MNIGERLKEYLKYSGMNANELAKIVGVSPSTIYSIIRNNGCLGRKCRKIRASGLFVTYVRTIFNAIQCYLRTDYTTKKPPSRSPGDMGGTAR